MECKDYPGITREMFEQGKKEVAKTGLALPEGDSYKVERSGVTLSVDYQESTQTVKVCIVERPSFIPESLIWSMVDQTMQAGA